ncbi:P-loop containing nucleoside triphosphate hydrolase protein [Sistotremastrum suecicum HHB10207 ss-3]|uniref:Eukaryotic translation initiation factor 5B n=1 Tax=Sistotremastrum suecicum HHB10207 ss-3 TaxID=1314776 RepID=A0A165Z2D9_9AGAM|nr:P-loop containing nucleoside triphosphate hydrolase protein [Sistotremastrum suecicum HHB10207 ss-3]
MLVRMMKQRNLPLPRQLPHRKVGIVHVLPHPPYLHAALATNGKNGTAATPKATAARSKSPTPLKPSLKPGAKAAPSPAPKAAPGSAKKTPVKEESESESESEEEDSEEDSDSDDSDEDSSDDDGMTTAQRLQAQRKAEAVERRKKAYEAAVAARNKDDLRSPICCILGHVDTGKTKLLDKIRQTNVQEGEAGGITQQIGATYFPVDAIKQKTQVVNTAGTQEYKIPGLLIIDTPGHESFTNLRSRGSSLCNIAILVVDIMHYLEPQTLESLRLLRDRKTPFIVALNKIDRIYGWEATPDNGFQDSLAKQKPAVQREFADRVQKTILAFAEQGLNSVLYYENKNFARNVSLVPTSAITGEGVPDMIMLLVNLTQQRMSESLMYLSTLECTVLEVKVIEGLGTTIDVVLSNGILHEGDKIVVCGLNGPIITQVRALLTPQPLRELRIKSQYVHHKEVKAALGVKIAAPDLEKAIAGSRLLVCGPDDDEEELAEEVMSDLTSLMESIDKSGRGVCVQASTLGSLEALLDFLKVSKIPVSGIDIGPVHKKNIRRAATMLEKAKELACILCFDVPVDKEAEKLAEEEGIKLFKADIIYHLFDAFTAYNAEITEAKRKDAAPQAVWPCRLKTIAVFAKRDPIILGVDILDGTLRVGTPLCVVKVDPVTQKKEIIDLGKITSLEINHKSMELVKKSQAGGGVAVKIESAVYQSTKMFGRHFDDKDEIVSHITRQSIDVLKSSFKEDVSMEEWHLIKALKPVRAL